MLFPLIHYDCMALIALLSVGVILLTGIGLRVHQIIYPSRELPFALYVGVGQIALVVWIYIRSTISYLSELGTGSSIPISQTEILLLGFIALVGVDFKKLLPIISDLLLFLGCIFLIAQRELPREIMLSADPDQHLYFATQIIRLGGVPYSQDYFGPESFGYPAGFAVVSVIWSFLSFVAPKDVITVLPQIQVILALLALPFIVQRIFQKSVTGGKNPFLFSLSLLVLYWCLAPYPLEERFYHLEGTGRVSVLLLSIFSLIGFSAYRGPQLAALTLMNPVAVIIPGFVGALYEFVEKRSRAVISLAWQGLVFFLIVLLDPYYQSRLFGSSDARAINEYIPPLFDFFSFIFNKDFFLAPFVSNYVGGAYVSSLVVLILIAGIYWRAGDDRKTFLRYLGVFLLVMYALQLLCFPMFRYLSAKGDLYLLEPYFSHSIEQHVYLWMFFLFGIALAHIFEKKINFFVGLISVLFMGAILYAYQNVLGFSNLTPRYGYCGSMGCLHEDDKKAFTFLEEEFQRYLVEGGELTFEKVPKILIPNHPFRKGPEKWIMPHGAARNIPFIQTFPAAFYYFQGSKEYSFDSYRQHVCKVLDREWLLSKNIKYLFVPTDNPGSCIRQLKQLKKLTEKILFRSNESFVISLG